MASPNAHPRDVQLDAYSAALVALARSAHRAALLERAVTSRLLGLAQAVRDALVADAGALAVEYGAELRKLADTLEDADELAAAIRTRIDQITRVHRFNARRDRAAAPVAALPAPR